MEELVPAPTLRLHHQHPSCDLQPQELKRLALQGPPWALVHIQPPSPSTWDVGSLLPAFARPLSPFCPTYSLWFVSSLSLSTLSRKLRLTPGVKEGLTWGLCTPLTLHGGSLLPCLATPWTRFSWRTEPPSRAPPAQRPRPENEPSNRIPKAPRPSLCALPARHESAAPSRPEQLYAWAVGWGSAAPRTWSPVSGNSPGALEPQPPVPFMPWAARGRWPVALHLPPPGGP